MLNGLNIIDQLIHSSMQTLSCIGLLFDKSDEFYSELLNKLKRPIDAEDLRIDVFRDPDDRNKTAPPVRLTHIPSGIVVSCEDYPQQKQNYIISLVELRNQLLEH